VNERTDRKKLSGDFGIVQGRKHLLRWIEFPEGFFVLNPKNILAPATLVFPERIEIPSSTGVAESLLCVIIRLSGRHWKKNKSLKNEIPSHQQSGFDAFAVMLWTDCYQFRCGF
jgi:hypothetical protein